MFYSAYFDFTLKKWTHSNRDYQAGKARDLMCFIGFFFFSGLFIFLMFLFDFPLFSTLGKYTEIGIFLFVVFIITLPLIITNYIFRKLCLNKEKYLSFSSKYPEIQKTTIRKFNQKYLVVPFVFSVCFLLLSCYLVIKTGRGV